jgi:hypothetical protein
MIRFTLDDILGGLCIAAMIFGAPYALAILQAVAK